MQVVVFVVAGVRPYPLKPSALPPPARTFVARAGQTVLLAMGRRAVNTLLDAGRLVGRAVRLTMAVAEVPASPSPPIPV